MKRLSELVDDEVVRALRERIASGSFPGIPFETAMEFLLSDGIMPESGLPVASLLELQGAHPQPIAQMGELTQ